MSGMTAEQVAEFVRWLRADMAECVSFAIHQSDEGDKRYFSGAAAADKDALNKLREMGVISDPPTVNGSGGREAV